jgi:16S rRNA (guanine527-N7)-methyltransferase
VARDGETAGDDDLLPILSEAQQQGFVGPGPLEPHLAHAAAMAEAVEPDLPDRALDLGSGAGLPGLVLARRWPTTSWVLLDANERRCAFLERVVGDLALGDRVKVVRARAESAAHDPAERARFDLVTARAFGPPAVVAECAAGFLRIGGLLTVSEPPDPTGMRWTPEGLEPLGLRLDERQDPGYVRLRQHTPCPPRFPRRVGIPAKRPLF